ncbi:ABC transporter ATP-binding protein [Herbiconiux daphne]|uniref:ATP-binding cassette domain-containing protein n=1 Tax=Herbiconiux daphne TaxID=2970914 RepID=A0ABT2GWI5_9MICO|nr:ATP-binding cassette domain-containing protein [Herbiconiux daphne]MCS5732330.1 ATP-binding cassette domain-containing protein [Herbiconiux daphne]
MDTVVEVSGLEKRFGRVRALDGLDLSVRAGEVHGFLGPNGAGKSTTIRILLGLARASAGTARVFGRDPWSDAVALHRRLGYVPGDVNLWPNLSGGEAIDLISRLRGGTADKTAFRERKQRLIDVFQFDPTKKGRAYSKGNRQKVALIAAFATPADLLILDEPTSGLDPLMEAVFDTEVHRAAAEGTTVLLSSHILSEVEQLCDRVTIIRAGRTAETGTLADLRHLTRTEVSFAVDGVPDAAAPASPDAVAPDARPAAAPGAAPASLQAAAPAPREAAAHRHAGPQSDLRDLAAALPGAHDLAIDAGRAHFTVDSDALPPVLEALARLDVRGLTVAPPSLEELFLRHYGDHPARPDPADRQAPAPTIPPTTDPRP